jgi:hypothetical protein
MLGALRIHIVVSSLLAVSALGLAACGGGSSKSSAGAPSSTTTPRRGGFFGAARDPKVVACLKKQGVTFPPRRARPRNGAPPARPRGSFPRNGAFAQRFQKLRTALQKCGVTLPTGPPGAGPPGGSAPPASSTTSSS